LVAVQEESLIHLMLESEIEAMRYPLGGALKGCEVGRQVIQLQALKVSLKYLSEKRE
jgi:hypothetical protein